MEERIDEVLEKLFNFEWYPKFNNAFELKGNKEWYETNIPAITSVEPKLAWSQIPQNILNYIISLPEFDAEIFKEITGIEV